VILEKIYHPPYAWWRTAPLLVKEGKILLIKTQKLVKEGKTLLTNTPNLVKEGKILLIKTQKLVKEGKLGLFKILVKQGKNTF